MPLSLPLTLLLLATSEAPTEPQPSAAMELNWQVIDLQASAKSGDPKPWLSERRPPEIDAPAPVPLHARFDENGRPQVFHAPTTKTKVDSSGTDQAADGEEPKR